MKLMATAPRPGRFDDEGYMRLYPEVEELGVTPFEHYTENRRNKVVVRGRVGMPDRGWVALSVPVERRYWMIWKVDGALGS